MLSISRFSRKRGQGRWIIGLQRAGLAGICRLPDREQSLVTRISCDGGAGLSALSDFLSPQRGDDWGAKPPDRVGVVISNQFCRYLAIPWSDSLLAIDRGQAYLRRAFVDNYGDIARAWEIGCQDAGYGRPRVACAIDGGVLHGVRAACKNMGQTTVNSIEHKTNSK